MIDLTGASLRHGLPTDDREYSLMGRAISGGDRPQVGEREAVEFTQEVRGVGLKLVARGALPERGSPKQVVSAPVDMAARRAEYERLAQLAKTHHMRIGVASAKYFEKFGEWPAKEWA